MCGRYTLIKLAQLPDLFPWIKDAPRDLPPRFNIAPSQDVLAIANDRPNEYQFLHWGLIPSWAKDPSIGNTLCNARGETLGEKPIFRKAYQRRRCLLPTDGFYEWKKLSDGKTKIPYYIQLKSHEPFALAGLWETWQDDKGNELRSCTIITTDANALVAELHDRMPVILRKVDHARWLDQRELKAEELNDLLKPYPAEEMESFPVSTRVNNVKNDGPQLVIRDDPPKMTLFD
jgi:putative SOS response-associated peptidase YedK